MLDEQDASSIVSETNRDILLPSLGAWNLQGNRQWYLTFKQCKDWLLALAMLVLISPLLIFLAVLVKITSEGPIIYKQSRLGYRGRVFEIFKIRTMVKNAELDTGPVWAAKEDSRVTYLGAVLRMTHLDELPQLFNVLRGEMSLIGPRPERPEIASLITQTLPAFRRRLAVRPGITGLAQVMLPADDPADEALECVQRKLECDLYYAGHMGFLMDARIYICTFFRLLALAMESVCLVLTGSARAAIKNNRPIHERSAQYKRIS
jgi:lipopolysaccharide/colanic/teichoic acid biosynthesis glycosyltransferase